MDLEFILYQTKHVGSLEIEKNALLSTLPWLDIFKIF